jgi:hypothetical protein
MNTVVRTCENSELLITTAATINPIRPPVHLPCSKLNEVVLQGPGFNLFLLPGHLEGQMLPAFQFYTTPFPSTEGFGTWSLSIQITC